MPKPTKIALTEIEKKCFAALSHVTFLPASFDKRFSRNIIGASILTEKQRNYAVYLFNKYRRQIHNYQELAFQLQPERFDVKVTFDKNLFSDSTSEVEFKDTFKPHKYKKSDL